MHRWRRRRYRKQEREGADFPAAKRGPLGVVSVFAGKIREAAATKLRTYTGGGGSTCVGNGTRIRRRRSATITATDRRRREGEE